MTATTLSPVSSRRAHRAERAAVVTRPSALTVLGEALSAVRALQTATPDGRRAVAERFAARI